jgi:hypothetical protein
MPRRFTLAEAQSLIPQVELRLREALAVKSEYDEAGRAFQSFQERVMNMGGMVLDRERALKIRRSRDAAAARLRNAIEGVQETGCVVKDLDIGLVDFMTSFRGVDVYLCWKLGESAIEYWHSMEEGFRGRKAIDQDFIDHHAGDPAN